MARSNLVKSEAGRRRMVVDMGLSRVISVSDLVRVWERRSPRFRRSGFHPREMGTDPAGRIRLGQQGLRDCVNDVFAVVLCKGGANLPITRAPSNQTKVGLVAHVLQADRRA